MNRIIYQTVEDRNNPDYVEQHGPFLCTKEHAWFGKGYYFWDTIIELAHWWGKLCYTPNGYIICRSSCDSSLSKVYDLVGRPELLLEFEECSKIIMKQRKQKTIYVPEVIEYLKTKTSFLEHYAAIRANPLHTLPPTFNQFQYKINEKNRGVIDTRPAIQFCFF